MAKHMEINTPVSVGVVMEFNVLGPVGVSDAGSSLTAGGPKQRTVLAVLIANVGKVVSADSIAQAVYGEDVPTRGRRTIQTYVSTLRSVVGDAIVKEAAGWRLTVDRSAVDAARFEDLCESARELSPDDASEILRDALALWRGHPFADIEAHGILDGEINRLTELRVSAQQERIDADLETGRQADLVGEIESLLAEHPYRERFRAQHMLALYRAGRQKEALLSYSQMRTALLDELGVDPAPELQELEQRILRQDDSLLVAPNRAIVRRAVLVADPGDPLELARLPAAQREHILTQSAAALRSGIHENNGGPAHPAGTATYVVFDSPDQAVSAAAATNRRLDGAGMRIAIDWGDVEVSDGSVSGPPVSRAAVLVSVAHPGQVILSTEAQQQLVSDGAGAGVRFESLGTHSLPGVEGTVPIYQLVVGDPERTFPPLQTGRIPPPLPDGAHRSVPGYELREPLGSGSIGTLYRAYQPSVGREVMIEVIGRSESSDPDFIRNFEADAQRLALLDHPSVNTLLDYWRDTEGAYLVYRHHRGGFLEAGHVAAPQVLGQVASALAYVHSYGVVHGSLRPNRIVLDESGNAYLIGFPIGGVAPLSSPDYPAYIAPETLSGLPPSVATDVFGLGVLAYEIEAGPIGGDEALSPTSAVLARAVSDDPDDRQGSILALLEQLEPDTGEALASRFTKTRNPYKGLAAFHESDAADFYGRGPVTDELVASLRRSRFLAVVGPSGIGKSSVVRAGLIPALRAGAIDDSDTWVISDMLPGSHPFLELQRALERVAVDLPVDLRESFADRDPNALEGLGRVLPEGSELLLIIDQFEELFTMCDEAVAAKFLDLLVTADESHQARVVITLRADFLDRPLRYSRFGELLRGNLVTVRSPNLTELGEAVSGPISRVGVGIEEALTVRILSEVHDRPSALPLLQYTLSELFESRTSDMLTMDAYERLGGVTGSLADRAESMYRGFDPDGQTALEQVLLRLVAVSDGSAPTRRRVKVTALEDLDASHVIDAFARSRLLAFDSDPDTRTPTIEVAHEALLTHWPRLAEWIDATREDLTLSRRLEESRLDWEANERRDPYLLTGGRLAQHQTWSTDTSLVLTDADTEYLVASARHDGDLRAGRRRLRNWVTAGFAAAAVVAGVLGLAAWSNARTADEKTELAEQSAVSAQDAADSAAASELVAQENAQDAITARTEAQSDRDQAVEARNEADAARETAENRGLIASSSAAVDEDPELAVMLALIGSTGLGDDPQALATLRESLGASTTLFYEDIVDEELGLSISGDVNADGTRVLVGHSNGRVELFDVETGEEIWQFDAGSADSRSLFASPSFANGDTEVVVVIQSVLDETLVEGVPIVILDADSGVILRQYSGPRCGWARDGVQPRDDTILLLLRPTADFVESNGCGRGNDAVRVSLRLFWFDVNTGETTLAESVDDVRLFVPAVAMDSDRTRRARIDAETNRIIVDDLITGQVLVDLPVGHDDDDEALAMSPDGSTVVTGAKGSTLNGRIRVIDVDAGVETSVLSGHAGGTAYFEFFDDSRRLISTGQDGFVKTWDLVGGGLISSVDPGGGRKTSLHLSDDERRVAVFGIGAATLLSLDEADRADIGVLETCDGFAEFYVTGGVKIVGSTIVTLTVCREGAAWAELFDSATGSRLHTPSQVSGQRLDLSLDGRFLAHQIGTAETDSSPGTNGTVAVIELATGDEVRMEGLCTWHGDLEGEGCADAPDEPYGVWVWDLDFSPDGAQLAMSPAFGGPGRVWNTATGETLAVWDFLEAEFSPDGSKIVSSSRDQLLELRETVGFTVLATLQEGFLEEGNNFRFTPDGETIVATGGGDLIVYDVATLTEKSRRAVANSRDVAMSVDGSIVALAGEDGIVTVWNIETLELIHTIPVADDDRVQSVAFANDDQHLLASTPRGPIVIYTLDRDELIESARTRLVRGFTTTECDRYFPDATCPTLEEMRRS